MILGTGTDLANIERIGGTIARFGDRFLTRVFTETERTRSDRRTARIESYAKRWAAKEACAKALGTGLRMGVAWAEMGVVNLRSGQPTITVTGGAAARLARLTPPGFRPRIHCTLTDDHPWAQAVVTIAAVPEAWPEPPSLPAG